LLTFFDFPAEHWVHVRTSNPIESAFSTVRLRQRVTKGAGFRRRGLTMAFKLLEMAQQRWRRLNASELLPLVRAGIPVQERSSSGARRSNDRRAARGDRCLIIPIHNI
jgi:transposase-like protein